MQLRLISSSTFSGLHRRRWPAPRHYPLQQQVMAMAAPSPLLMGRSSLHVNHPLLQRRHCCTSDMGNSSLDQHEEAVPHPNVLPSPSSTGIESYLRAFAAHYATGGRFGLAWLQSALDEADAFTSSSSSSSTAAAALSTLCLQSLHVRRAMKSVTWLVDWTLETWRSSLTDPGRAGGHSLSDRQMTDLLDFATDTLHTAITQLDRLTSWRLSCLCTVQFQRSSSSKGGSGVPALHDIGVAAHQISLLLQYVMQVQCSLSLSQCQPPHTASLGAHATTAPSGGQQRVARFDRAEDALNQLLKRTSLIPARNADIRVDQLKFLYLISQPHRRDYEGTAASGSNTLKDGVMSAEERAWCAYMNEGCAMVGKPLLNTSSNMMTAKKGSARAVARQLYHLASLGLSPPLPSAALHHLLREFFALAMPSTSSLPPALPLPTVLWHRSAEWPITAQQQQTGASLPAEGGPSPLPPRHQHSIRCYLTFCGVSLMAAAVSQSRQPDAAASAPPLRWGVEDVVVALLCAEREEAQRHRAALAALPRHRSGEEVAAGSVPSSFLASVVVVPTLHAITPSVPFFDLLRVVVETLMRTQLHPTAVAEEGRESLQRLHPLLSSSSSGGATATAVECLHRFLHHHHAAQVEDEEVGEQQRRLVMRALQLLGAHCPTTIAAEALQRTAEKWVVTWAAELRSLRYSCGLYPEKVVALEAVTACVVETAAAYLSPFAVQSLVMWGDGLSGLFTQQQCHRLARCVLPGSRAHIRLLRRIAEAGGSEAVWQALHTQDHPAAAALSLPTIYHTNTANMMMDAAAPSVPPPASLSGSQTLLRAMVPVPTTDYHHLHRLLQLTWQSALEQWVVASTNGQQKDSPGPAAQQQNTACSSPSLTARAAAQYALRMLTTTPEDQSWWLLSEEKRRHLVLTAVSTTGTPARGGASSSTDPLSAVRLRMWLEELLNATLSRGMWRAGLSVLREVATVLPAASLPSLSPQGGGPPVASSSASTSLQQTASALLEGWLHRAQQTRHLSMLLGAAQKGQWAAVLEAAAALSHPPPLMQRLVRYAQHQVRATSPPDSLTPLAPLTGATPAAAAPLLEPRHCRPAERYLHTAPPSLSRRRQQRRESEALASAFIHGEWQRGLAAMETALVRGSVAFQDTAALLAFALKGGSSSREERPSTAATTIPSAPIIAGWQVALMGFHLTTSRLRPDVNMSVVAMESCAVGGQWRMALQVLRQAVLTQRRVPPRLISTALVTLRRCEAWEAASRTAHLFRGTRHPQVLEEVMAVLYHQQCWGGVTEIFHDAVCRGVVLEGSSRMMEMAMESSERAGEEYQCLASLVSGVAAVVEDAFLLTGALLEHVIVVVMSSSSDTSRTSGTTGRTQPLGPRGGRRSLPLW